MHQLVRFISIHLVLSSLLHLQFIHFQSMILLFPLFVLTHTELLLSSYKGHPYILKNGHMLVPSLSQQCIGRQCTIPSPLDGYTKIINNQTKTVTIELAGVDWLGNHIYKIQLDKTLDHLPKEDWSCPPTNLDRFDFTEISNRISITSQKINLYIEDMKDRNTDSMIWPFDGVNRLLHRNDPHFKLYLSESIIFTRMQQFYACQNFIFSYDYCFTMIEVRASQQKIGLIALGYPLQFDLQHKNITLKGEPYPDISLKLLFQRWLPFLQKSQDFKYLIQGSIIFISAILSLLILHDFLSHKKKQQ